MEKDSSIVGARDACVIGPGAYYGEGVHLTKCRILHSLAWGLRMVDGVRQTKKDCLFWPGGLYTSKELGHMWKVQGMFVLLGLGPVYDEYPPI